jgi:hypothetical protein
MAKEQVCTLICSLALSVMFLKYFDVSEMESKCVTWITTGSRCYLPRVRD